MWVDTRRPQYNLVSNLLQSGRKNNQNQIISRRDKLHFCLRHTLEKDNWIITDDPLTLVLEETLLKADLGAEKILAAEK